uniref:Uncharacterized protein n=1 Tax=Esox lucius TaxID=8010 RepID=A0AAY5KAA9_ESOLU
TIFFLVLKLFDGNHWGGSCVINKHLNVLMGTRTSRLRLLSKEFHEQSPALKERLITGFSSMWPCYDWYEDSEMGLLLPCFPLLLSGRSLEW